MMCSWLISLSGLQNWVDIGLFGALPTYLTMWCVFKSLTVPQLHLYMNSTLQILEGATPDIALTFCMCGKTLQHKNLPRRQA